MHQRIQRRPVLRPHVAGDMCRDRAVLGHLARILVFELAAHIALQLRIQRLDLAPEAIGLRAQGCGIHVVAGAPGLASIGIAGVACAFVEQFGEALIVSAHPAPDRMPTLPGFQIRIPVTAFRENLGQLVEIPASGGIRRVLAGFAGAVGRTKFGGEGGHLGQMCRILWRRHRTLALEHLDATCAFGADSAHAIEAVRGINGVFQTDQAAFVGLGLQHAGIRRDVRRCHPLRGDIFDIVIADLLVHAGDKRVSFDCVHRFLRCRGGRLGTCWLGTAAQQDQAAN